MAIRKKKEVKSERDYELFDTQEQLQACYDKWAPRLGLSDWLIKIVFASEEQLHAMCPELSGVGTVYGLSLPQQTGACGRIFILDKAGVESSADYMKSPHEATVIHEMLHFVWHTFDHVETNTDEYYSDEIHQRIEVMARALYMAEHGVTTKEWWFKEV